MPDETSAEEAHEPVPATESAPAVEESMTPGGYSYTVVDDGHQVERVSGNRTSGRGVPPIAAVAAILVVAALTGVLVWLFAPAGGGDSNTRLGADVANVLNAFSQGQSGAVTTRYEGELPPGFPDDLPIHNKAKVVSSIAQVRGDDASYLVIWDTADTRDSVAEDYRTKFSADPWQIDVTQDSRDSTLHQFTKINDPDVAGVVLIVDSKNGKTTTILASVQVTSGGKNAKSPPFSLAAPRALPSGFPDSVPPYSDATLIESTYQQAAGSKNYAASYVTKDGASGVLDFYRGKLQDAKFTVADGDASQSGLTDAQAIQFTDDAKTLSGGVTVSKFAEDETYTRIDVTFQVTKQ